MHLAKYRQHCTSCICMYIFVDMILIKQVRGIKNVLRLFMKIWEKLDFSEGFSADWAPLESGVASTNGAMASNLFTIYIFSRGIIFHISTGDTAFIICWGVLFLSKTTSKNRYEPPRWVSQNVELSNLTLFSELCSTSIWTIMPNFTDSFEYSAPKTHSAITTWLIFELELCFCIT